MVKFIQIFGQIFLGALMLIAVLYYFYPDRSLVNFLSHFLFYYLFASLLVFLISIYLKSFKGVLIAITLFACYSYQLKDVFLPAPNLSFGEACADLKIMQVNLSNASHLLPKTKNPKKDSSDNSLSNDFVELTNKHNPEVLFLTSVSSELQESLAESYPYRIFQPDENGLGVAVLSKIPIDDINLPLFDKSIIEVGLKLADDLSLNILGFGKNIGISRGLFKKSFPKNTKNKKKIFEKMKIDPRRPVLSEFDILPSMIQIVARRIRASQQPYILIGSLNTTPWSTFYKPIERFTGLKNAGYGKGFMSTWPSSLATLPLVKYFALPLDQTLVHRSLEVESHETFRVLNSNNLGLLSHIKVPCDLSTTE